MTPDDRSFDAFLQAHPAAAAQVRADPGLTEAGRYRLRVGDRPFPGVTLSPVELATLTPDGIEPAGWIRPGPEAETSHEGQARQEPAQSWSDLLVYDPTGIVGDITSRAGTRRGTRGAPAGRAARDVIAANEARLLDQGFRRPGPRRGPVDIGLGARYLFKRAVLRMSYPDIAEEEPHTNARVDEIVVRKTTTRWADELGIPLPRRGKNRVRT